MNPEKFITILFLSLLFICFVILGFLLFNGYKHYFPKKVKPKPSELVDKVEQFLQEHLGTTDRIALVVCYDVKDEVGIATNIENQSAIEVMEDVIYNLKYKK